MSKTRGSAVGLLSFVACVSMGCANLKAVARFADGVDVLAASSGRFYDASLASDRALAATTVCLAEQPPRCDGPDRWDGLGDHLIGESRRHAAAVAALASYASFLREIATFDDEKAIHASAEKLSGELHGLAARLSGGSRGLPDDSVLATALASVAGIYVDLRKQAVIREKARDAQPHVEAILSMLEQDIRRQQQRLGVERLAATARREEWFEQLQEGYRTASPAEQARRDRAAGELIQAELTDRAGAEPAAAFVEQLGQTVVSCREAHRAIQVRGLSEHAAAISVFRRDATRLIQLTRSWPTAI